MSALRTKVMVVEDDTVIALALNELLTDNDFDVFSAPNGKVALDELRKTSTKPNLILLDLMMPVMDGFEFRQLQLSDTDLRSIPVVVMSADGHVEEKRVRTQAGAYLKKPVDIFDLLDIIRKHATPVV